MRVLRRNQNQSPEENFETLKAIKHRASDADVDLVAYVSMAFGNPCGDAWSEGALAEMIGRIVGVGIRSISLADTVGMADPELIHRVVVTALKSSPGSEIGVHLHSTTAEAAAKILSAYDAGCHRFDSAIGGLGGCPFAQDALVGNIPTEGVIAALRQRGLDLPLNIESLLPLNAQIGSEYS